MYGQRLQEAGVPAQVKRYNGMIHGFTARPEFDQAKLGLALKLALGKNYYLKRYPTPTKDL